MFCTSLRRRASFAITVPALKTPPLSLRESQLGTHDLEIPFASTLGPNTGNPLSARSLRVLLISPGGVREARLDHTLQRIEHFAVLTGGQDLVIVFLLNPPLDTNFVIAEELAARPSTSDASVEGVYTMTTLQTELLQHPGIPHIPKLLLYKADGIQQLLRNYITNLTCTIPTPRPFAGSLDLLQHCTASQAMPQQTAYLLSDLFPSIRHLATACSNVNSAPNSSSPSTTTTVLASQLNEVSNLSIGINTQSSDSHANEKLKTLRDLVGTQECQDIIDFWKEEWIVD